MQGILDKLEHESDRGAVLITAAWVDDALKEYLRSHLIDDSIVVDKLLGLDRPLGTFSSRITLCYCMGFIGPQIRSDLDVIRDVRNDFAHVRSEISFSTDSIRDRSLNLKTLEVFHQFTVTQVTDPKLAFVLSGFTLVRYFLEMTRPSNRAKDSKDEGYAVYIKGTAEALDRARAERLLSELEAKLGTKE
jgi:DNA-binding MltR family transcriptional regulator